MQAYKGINNFYANVILVLHNDLIVGSLLYVIQKEAKGVWVICHLDLSSCGGPLALDNNLEIIDILLQNTKGHR